ncbi:MAG: protein-glutamate O-methyltransferase family protein [Ardenticatenaceae bacterium]|nr:protein-glutamate O-methyltransferase family protein [Ardenticatenaceae bacterium]MCB8987204.1 protein-glutamate O-methyltransferase family protein [Ardenticatenaceae bacterium]
MPDQRLPALPLPAPLRGSETGSFTHYSIAVRLPDIGRRIVAENNFRSHIAADIQALIEEIPNGAIRPLFDHDAPDAGDWRQYCLPYLGQSWLQAPWFFVETYFYRRVLEATQYFEQGAATAVYDPFARQKKQGLLSSRAVTRDLCAAVNRWLGHPAARRDALHHLLSVALWGNQADLSMWPADSDDNPSHGEEERREHLLLDESTAVIDHLLAPDRPIRLDLIADNAGFELVGDLCLLDYALHSDTAESVTLHLKSHPTFVSDATPTDVRQTITYLAQADDPEMKTVGGRLQAALDDGRLQLRDHLFWTSPLAMWEMPASLAADLQAAHLVISKGDANYRRLLGDRHWAFDTPFADVVAYFPASLLALRTLKSEVVVGLAPDLIAAMPQRDPDWLINGRWGLIQFAPLA